MSFEAFVWAWRQPLENASDQHILLALANVAPIRETFASAGYLAGITHRSERQVRRCLDSLEADGWITVTERPGRTPVIRLNIPDDFVVTMPKEGDLEAGKRGRPSEKTPDKWSENPGHFDEKPSPLVSTEPLEEPKNEPMRTDVLVGKPDEVTAAFAEFNMVSASMGGEVARNLTDARKRRIRARLREVGGLSGWTYVLTKVQDSPFLSGRTEDKFKLSLDFLIDPGKFTRILEGYYRERAVRLSYGDQRAAELEEARNLALAMSNGETHGPIV